MALVRGCSTNQPCLRPFLASSIALMLSTTSSNSFCKLSTEGRIELESLAALAIELSTSILPSRISLMCSFIIAAVALSTVPAVGATPSLTSCALSVSTMSLKPSTRRLNACPNMVVGIASLNAHLAKFSAKNSP